eukprot:c17572_g1_i2.p1 GENE.c17572_g1_i2~~c17572_g1_i2.p1  ORF type:complete len:308 (+),score=64.49 c17572_g1_i2:264-1187(+)
MPMPLLRNILIRESIDIVHGHQAFSVMSCVGLVHAKTMGYRTCFTTHSLFGFAEASSINGNKFLEFVMTSVDRIICVSHTCRENSVLRMGFPPEKSFVIPNAIDFSKFTPPPAPPPTSRIVVVVVGRLVYRKGADLLKEVIVQVCERHPQVDFVIAGDGDKTVEIEEVVEKHALLDRVEMIGALPHDQVRGALCRGHIFLNCSLTEAFCMAIVEAAAVGLLVVSTNVGGIPEVLPPHMAILVAPTAAALTEGVSQALPCVGSIDPHLAHETLKHIYRSDRQPMNTKPLTLMRTLPCSHVCSLSVGRT